MLLFDSDNRDLRRNKALIITTFNATPLYSIIDNSLTYKYIKFIYLPENCRLCALFQVISSYFFF